MGSSEKYAGEIKEIQNKLVNTSLLVASISGLPLLIISIIRSIKYNQIYFAIVNAAVYFIILIVTFLRKKINFSFRALSIVLLLIVLAFADFYNVGILSMGYIWVTAAAIFSFIFFNLKNAILTISVSIVIIVSMKVLQIYDIKVYTIDFNQYAKSLLVMLLRTLSFVLVSLIIVFSIRHITSSLNESILKLQLQRNNLINSAQLMRNEIKQRKKMQEAVLQSEKKFKNIFETSSDPIVIVGLDGLILDCNKAFVVLAEIDESKIKGINFFQLIPADYKDFFSRYKNDLEKIPNRFELKYVAQSSGEIKFLDIKNKIIDLGDSKALLAIIRDYTEKMNNERKIFSAAIEAEEKERFRLSKELHDGLGPLLSTLKIYFEAQKRRPNDSELPKRIKNILDESVKSVKDISNNLSPYVLQTLGVVQALKVFIDKILYTEELNVKFNYNFDIKFNEKIEITIYRLITELLNNTLKHAKATEVDIDLILKGSLLKILYSDNGVGFNPEKKNTGTTGIGLFNLKSRIEKMGGTFDIITSEGNGFKLYASIFVDDLKA